MHVDDAVAEHGSEESPATTATSTQLLGAPLRMIGTFAVAAAVFILTMVLPGPLWSLQTVGTISVFGLGPLLLVALWWPRRTRWGSRTLPTAVTALLTTLALIAVAIVLCGLTLAIVGRFEAAGLFADAAAQHAGVLTPFPFVTTLGALMFVSTLHLTLVHEKWLFDTGRPIRDGLVAFACCWVLAVAAYFVVANWNGVDPAVLQILGVRNPGGPVDALEMIGWLAWIACLDVVVMVLLRGWPFHGIRPRGGRIAVTSLVSLTAGTVSYVLARHALEMSSTEIAAVAAMVITAVFVLTIGLDGRLQRGIRPAPAERIVALAATGVVAAVLYAVLLYTANRFESWTDIPPQLWVAVAGLNILTPTLILYDAVWGRWPFTSTPDR